MALELEPRQRRAMKQDGYCVLESVFKPHEMHQLTSHIEALHLRHEESIEAHGGTEGISRAGEISFTAFLAEQDPAIRAFATRSEFVDLFTALLGPDTDLYWNQSVFKGPGCEQEFPWHQDDGYTPVEPSPYLTVWLALNDATLENGCISVLPGSYKRGLLPHRHTSIGLVCHDASHPDQGAPVPVSAGSMAVFWSLTCHRSGPNRSSGTRKAYVLQYSRSPLRNLATGEVLADRIPVARGGVAAS